jgi:hypothetical protein
MKKAIPGLFFVIFFFLTLPHTSLAKELSFIWSDKFPKYERFNVGTVVFKDQLWSIGGDGKYVDSGEVLSSKDGLNWELINPKAPFGYRDSHVLLVFKNKLWLIGGTDSDQGGMKNDVWCSEDGKNWNCVTPKAEFSPRSEMSGFVWNGKMWIVGGQLHNEGTYYVSSNESWCSTNGKTWTNVKSVGLPHIVNGKSVIFKNTIWIYGNEELESDQFECYRSNDGENWEASKTFQGGKFPFQRLVDLSAVVYDEQVWLFGGKDYKVNAKCTDEVWCSKNGINFTKSKVKFPIKNRESYSSILFNNSVYLVGGYDNSSLPQSDTISLFLHTYRNGEEENTKIHFELKIYEDEGKTQWVLSQTDFDDDDYNKQTSVYPKDSRSVDNYSEPTLKNVIWVPGKKVSFRYDPGWEHIDMVAIRNLKGGKYDWSITGKGEGETKVDGKYTLEVRSTKEIKLKFNTLRSVSLYHDGNE